MLNSFDITMADVAVYSGLNCQQKGLFGEQSFWCNSVHFQYLFVFVSVSLWLVRDCYSVFVVEGFTRDTHVCRKWRMFSLSALNAARSTTVWTNRLLYWTWHMFLILFWP